MPLTLGTIVCVWKQGSEYTSGAINELEMTYTASI